MKFLILASIVVFCGATTLFSGKNISVNDDGSIFITGANGKRVIITRPIGPNGQKNIEINVSGPNMPTKRIQIDDQGRDMNMEMNPWAFEHSTDEELRTKRGSLSFKKDKTSSQGDILLDIFRQYEGVVDDLSYDKLLKRMDKAVQKGELSSTIYDLLQNMNQFGETYGNQEIDFNMIDKQRNLYNNMLAQKLGLPTIDVNQVAWPYTNRQLFWQYHPYLLNGQQLTEQYNPYVMTKQPQLTQQYFPYGLNKQALLNQQFVPLLQDQALMGQMQHQFGGINQRLVDQPIDLALMNTRTGELKNVNPLMQTVLPINYNNDMNMMQRQMNIEKLLGVNDQIMPLRRMITREQIPVVNQPNNYMYQPMYQGYEQIPQQFIPNQFNYLNRQRVPQVVY